jgi:hypothetical protein
MAIRKCGFPFLLMIVILLMILVWRPAFHQGLGS